MQNGRDENNSPRYGGESSFKKMKPNILLIGVMGSGKTTVGELLARFLGFGFVDVDTLIERSQGKSIATLFEQKGEDGFRAIEKAQVNALGNIRNHVISAGGGAILDEDNWDVLSGLATSVWLKTPAIEIARRIVMSPDEIRKRPLIADLVNTEERMDRQKQLEDRLQTLEKQRANLYNRADLTVEYAYATPETCAHFLKAHLSRHGAY